MYRFFVREDQIGEETITIYGADVNHIKNVLRMRVGEELLISASTEKEYHCKISELSKEEVICEITDIDGESKELPSKIYLFQGLPKSEKMELIIQKAVELGAFAIVPVEMKRCVVKLEEKKKDTRQKRWQAIAESAAKQAKRSIIPEVMPVMTYKQALAFAKQLDVILLPYEEAENMQMTRDVFSAIKKGQSIGIFIGPEGGFAPSEVEDAVAAQAKSITLGKRILRTETAGMTVLSILMYLLEE
ncbi:MAG: 16S rRNA (uracil(1498)-N(3))-methyltransferase [Lachnospiraceae bacterium]|nr:16S rRNA (uracil(1498)-N(3))-methyltransferase [Lachnospiraceae bacterium]